MNKLSYRYKFLLIASLFILPLTLFAVRLAMTFHTTVDHAQSTRDGLHLLLDATELISQMEELRDTAVVSFVRSGSSFDKKHDGAKVSAIKHIHNMQGKHELSHHHGFLDQLSYETEALKISPGSEAASLDTVFETANKLVEKVHLWRFKLSYELISRSENQSQFISLLDLVNESDRYLVVLGKTRSLGSSYLHIKFIDSAGIIALDRNRDDYDKLRQNIDVKLSEYEKLLGNKGVSAANRLKRSLDQAQALLDETLLQVMDLTADPDLFYNQITAIMDGFHKHNLLLHNQADQLLSAQQKHASRQLMMFYISTAFMSLLAIYLYIGFFTSVRQTIRGLVKSAKRVSKGAYEKPIEIAAKDELQYLAEAMDEMRQALNMREEKLKLISQTDGLSQLKNRKFLDEALPLALSNCQRNNMPMCVVMMDIDHFKSVNDNYGHQAGDACIQAVASKLKSAFKRESDIVARYGGEEFIAVLCGTKLKEAMDTANTLKGQISELDIPLGNQTIQVTASFGIAEYDGVSLIKPQTLVEASDQFLYQAKNEGRNCIRGGSLSIDNQKDSD